MPVTGSGAGLLGQGLRQGDFIEYQRDTVKRDGNTGRIWLKDLYESSSNDIALRPGDVVLVEEDQRSFTAMGALGGQTKVPLGSEEISAMEAIAMVGGLSTNLADPTGVFVLRDEPESVARAVLEQPVHLRRQPDAGQIIR